MSARLDVRDLDALRAAVDGAVEQLGRLDVVVANAGVCVLAAWDQVSPEVSADTLSVNVTGVWNTVMAGPRTSSPRPRTSRAPCCSWPPDEARYVTAHELAPDAGVTES